MRNDGVMEVDRSREPVRAPAWEFFQPYAEFAADFLYNSLFCDSIALFQRDADSHGAAAAAALLSASAPQQLFALAKDESIASRIRALAWHGLRATGFPETGQDVLGVVIELPCARNQDTLAAYADGSVRYIRHSGEHSAFDSSAPTVSARARKLVAVAHKLLQRFEQPATQRTASPGDGRIRITLIASEGHYVCEGPFQALQKDPLAGPVLGNAIWLLQAQAAARTEACG